MAGMPDESFRLRAGPGILASAATGIVPFLERMGGDVDLVFGRANLAPDMTGNPTLKLRLESFCRLFEEAARQTRCDNFGLRFGDRFQPRDLGLWGYVAVTSATLREALENLPQTFPCHQGHSKLTLKRASNSLLCLEYQILTSAIVDRRQDAELSIGMFINVFRECWGPRWAPEEIHFEHPAPAESSEHEVVFNAPVYFSQPANALFFRPEILSRLMPGHDPRLLALTRTCLAQLGPESTAEQPLIDHIRLAIRQRLPDGAPTLDVIRRDMRVTRATISREVSQVHGGYRNLVDEVRRELAVSYLKHRQLPLSDVALLLGYSELSAFSRAFRRWAGCSPRAFRDRQSTRLSEPLSRESRFEL